MASQFKINVPDKALAALKDKLALSLSSLPGDAEPANDWNYGAPLKDVRRLAERWRDGFDWRAQEAKMNGQLPQFTTPIVVDGFGELNIHFVHKRSTQRDSIPLLFSHGCKLPPLTHS